MTLSHLPALREGLRSLLCPRPWAPLCPQAGRRRREALGAGPLVSAGLRGARPPVRPGPARDRGPSRETTPRARPAVSPPGSRAAPLQTTRTRRPPGRPLAFPLRLQHHPLQPRPLAAAGTAPHPSELQQGTAPRPPQPAGLALVPRGTGRGGGGGWLTGPGIPRGARGPKACLRDRQDKSAEGAAHDPAPSPVHPGTQIDG